MINNNVLGLYDHNLESYKRVREAYDSGEKVVGIIHATGTGKTLNALQLAYDNKNKKILYLTPYNSVIEHVKSVIMDNPNVDINDDFGHVKFMNYATLVNMSKEELTNLGYDMIILDEFHHIGAPVWGERVDTILETHPDILVFGMSAYSIRDRGSAYERDLAEDNGNELFSDKIVSRYDLVDAIIDGVLPIPIYKGAHIELLNMEERLEKMASTKCKSKDEFEKIIKVLRDIKRRISNSDTVHDVLKKNIKPDGKYIYFCPALSQNGVNDIETIMNETREYFLSNGYKKEDICFYVTTSDERELGKLNRKSFYNDVDLIGESVEGKLRIMFAINQYNEGVHAPNIDGVILGRETKSDIVFFEQMGRALSVRGDTYNRIMEYQKYSLDEIRQMCLDRDITISDNMSKDDMIERLVAPVIIDLVGNYSFIKDLVTELKHRVKEAKERGTDKERIINLTDDSFDIEFLEESIFNALLSIKECFVPKSFDEAYEIAFNYYNKYKDLNVSRGFKTLDGINYFDYGFALGEWVVQQRKYYNKGELSQDRIDKLNKIEMIWNIKQSWMDSYLMAKKYYNINNNLRIPSKFKTIDGVSFNIEGFGLGNWLAIQRRKYRLGLLKKKEIKLLEEIGIEWNIIKTWKESYQYAVEYYNRFGNLKVAKSYKASDGYALGVWIHSQKERYIKGNLSEEEIQLLNKLNIDWTIKEVKPSLSWDDNYKLAEKYYEHYKNLDIKRTFKTLDGVTLDKENGYPLGAWLSRQKVAYNKGKLSKDRIDKLESIGMIWENAFVMKSWDEAYNIAANYYNYYGNLVIPCNFKTEDGITLLEDGYNLFSWVYLQRKKYETNELDDEYIVKLNKIGMIWDIKKNNELVKDTLIEYKIPKKYYSTLNKLPINELIAKLMYLIDINKPFIIDGNLNDIFMMSDINMQVKYNVSRDDLINRYLSNKGVVI